MKKVNPLTPAEQALVDLENKQQEEKLNNISENVDKVSKWYCTGICQNSK